MRFLLVLLALPLWAANDDVGAILKRVIDAQRKNEKIGQQYTYTERTERFLFDPDGKEQENGSETHEVIFVEGLEYRKLVERDGKPLSAREQARVEKEMKQTAEQRRKHLHPTAAGGAVRITGLFTNRTADLGSLAELPRLYDNRLAGEEEIRGHKTWVVECSPHQIQVQMDEHDRNVLGFRKKIWVDEKEGALVRAMYTEVAPGGIMGPGSTLTFEYEKVDAEAWEPVSVTLEYSKSKSKDPAFKPAGKTVYRMDQFHKFDVQSSITIANQGK